MLANFEYFVLRRSSFSVMSLPTSRRPVVASYHTLERFDLKIRFTEIFLVTLPWFNIARGNTWCTVLASSLTILAKGQCRTLSSELVDFVKTNSPKLIIYSYLTCSCDFPRWRLPSMVWGATGTNRLLVDNVGTLVVDC